MTLPSEVYRHEAQRLYLMADSLAFGHMRNEFIAIACQYEALARHAELMERRTTTSLTDALAIVAPIGMVPER